MKKFAYIISLAATILAAASCQKEQLTQEQPTQKASPVFYATLENATKTTLAQDTGGYKISWELNDLISINGVDYFVNDIKGQIATFKKLKASDPDPEIDKEGYFRAYYPASIYDDSDVKLAILPDLQKYNKNGSIANILPMFAQTQESKDGTYTFNFKNLCGLMKFTLKGSEKLRYIRIYDEDKALSGDCHIDIADDGSSTAVLEEYATEGIVLDCGNDGVQLSAEGKAFYVAVPVGSYSNLRLEYNTVNYGKVCKMKANKEATVNRNTVYPFTQTPNFKNDWLCIEALEDENTTVKLIKEGEPADVNLQYSVNGGTTWTDYTVGDKINLTSSGSKVYFKAKTTNSAFADISGESHIFESDKNIKLSGNIMYLLNGTTPGTEVSVSAFSYLFAYNEHLITAEELRMPATTLAANCYLSMFKECSALTIAPELTAATLKTNCYNSMFSQCSSLTYVKCLAKAIEDGANGCTDNWLYKVPENGIFVRSAKSSTFWGSGASGIPSKWDIIEAIE